MDIEEVAAIIGRIADGLEDACARCLEDNKATVLQAVKEQLYSGQDAEGEHLSPTYDDDPFFNEPGYWYHRAFAYKMWKYSITPPQRGLMLGLSPRPVEVPNLFIDGTFYAGLDASRSADGLDLFATSKRGADIVDKYGDRILGLGPTAVEFFNDMYMLPAIGVFLKDCGYT